LLKKVLLIFLGIFSGLIVSELILAVFYPQKPLNIVAENIFFVEHDNELGWVNKKGAQGTYKPNPDEKSIHVRINSEGMRGGERNGDRNRDKRDRRILFLGDSVTFGHGIDESESYPEAFKTLLSDGYDVINLGVIGYGTDQEYLLLKREFNKYMPDMIVVGFTPGDVRDNMCSLMNNYYKPFFKLKDSRIELHGVPVPEAVYINKAYFKENPLKRFIYNNSNLYRLIFNRLIGRKAKIEMVEEMSRQEGLELTLRLLKEMELVCLKNGCRLVVLLLPNRIWMEEELITGKREGFYGFFINMLEQRGIPYIDTHYALMDRLRNGEELFLKGDPVHLNALGSWAVAEFLYKELKTRHHFLQK